VQQAKEVTLHTHAKNKYGRTLADVLLVVTGWHQRQPRTGQRRLLVVSEVCVEGYSR
jgi:hypothetical protein